MLDKNGRIVIVGGGIVGVSTAYFLTEAGYNNVVIYEVEYWRFLLLHYELSFFIHLWVVTCCLKWVKTSWTCPHYYYEINLNVCFPHHEVLTYNSVALNVNRFILYVHEVVTVTTSWTYSILRTMVCMFSILLLVHKALSDFTSIYKDKTSWIYSWYNYTFNRN